MKVRLKRLHKRVTHTVIGVSLLVLLLLLAACEDPTSGGGGTLDFSVADATLSSGESDGETWVALALYSEPLGANYDPATGSDQLTFLFFVEEVGESVSGVIDTAPTREQGTASVLLYTDIDTAAAGMYVTYDEEPVTVDTPGFNPDSGSSDTVSVSVSGTFNVQDPLTTDSRTVTVSYEGNATIISAEDFNY